MNFLNFNNYSSFSKLESFSSISEADVYFQSIGKQRWVQRIKLYQELGYESFIEGLISLENNYCYENPDMTISTLHQAKGLEFDNVKICDDWSLIDYKVQTQHAKETYNVLYVALTRAKNKLILNKSLELFFTKIFDSTNLRKTLCKTEGQCSKCKRFKFVNKIEMQTSYSSNKLTYLVCHDCSELL